MKVFYCTAGFCFASTNFEAVKKIFLFIFMHKKHLQNQEVLAMEFTTSQTALHSTGIVMLNVTVNWHCCSLHILLVLESVLIY